MSTKIYHVKHLELDLDWHYGSMLAIEKDDSNPVSIRARQMGVIAKKDGFPFVRNNCRINRVDVKSRKDVE